MHLPLRLYVDPLWRTKSLYTPLLFPFWGNPTPKSSLFAKEMFDAYQFDISLYTITQNIEEADMVLAPYRHNLLRSTRPEALEEYSRVAQKAGIPLLLDGMGDIEYPVTTPNTIVLRIGGYCFIEEKGRIVVPPSADDLLERCRGGVLDIRSKTEGVPVVGFAGWASLTGVQKIRTVVKELPDRLRGLFDDRYRAMQKGVLWRIRALTTLDGSQKVSLLSLARPSFSGTAKTASDDMRQLREEFVKVVLASDYALDVRGDANASTRLFEILSLGRIPVILDTERNFPFLSREEYKQFSLIVNFRDIERLPDIVADFHTRITDEEFRAMQQKARDAFVQYFRIDAQMRHIVATLSKMV